MVPSLSRHNGTKQVGVLYHPSSPDFAPLQLRNGAKSGDL